MFACVNYLDDRLIHYKIPTQFIKGFFPKDSSDYEEKKVYKVFWSSELKKSQENHERLKCLSLPPKHLWEKEKGSRYYRAYILRLGATLEDLTQSLLDKRPSVPSIPFQHDLSETTTEDEMPITKKDKKKHFSNKQLQLTSDLLTTVINARKDVFGNTKSPFLNKTNEKETTVALQGSPVDTPASVKAVLAPRCPIGDDSDNDEETSNENHLKNKILELEKEVESLKKDNAEVQQLRDLNRQLQKKFLDLSARGNLVLASDETPVVEELSEDISFGNCITLKRTKWEAIKAESSISKFTKSLSVAIWTSDGLKERSTTGVKCRNTNGCKRKLEGEESRAVEAKQRLTPEKLTVISSLMREYMAAKKMSIDDIETNIKRRNRYIAEKISDLNRKK